MNNKTILLLLFIFSGYFFQSCDENNDTDSTKENSVPQQYDESKKLIDAVNDGHLIFNESTPTDVSKFILGDEIDGMIKGERYFDEDSSFRLKSTVHFKEGKLHEIFYDFFFEQNPNAFKQIKTDSDKLKLLLDKNYGNPTDEYELDGMKSLTWLGNGYETRLEIFNDGYTIAYKSNKKAVAGDPSKSIGEIIRVTTPLLLAIKNESIKVGKTTDKELENLLGFSNGRLDIDFSDVILGAAYKLNDNNTINSINYSFYFKNEDKDLPRSLADVNTLFNTIESIFGNASSSEKFNDRSSDSWVFDQSSINLNSFDDGYSLSYRTESL